MDTRFVRCLVVAMIVPLMSAGCGDDGSSGASGDPYVNDVGGGGGFSLGDGIGFASDTQSAGADIAQGDIGSDEPTDTEGLDDVADTPDVALDDATVPPDVLLDVAEPLDAGADAGTPDAGADVEVPEPDQDSDGIPDSADPFPNDGTAPGVSASNFVYMHTASTLFRMNVKTYHVTEIGDFDWPGDSVFQMTDLAIDRHGVMYGVGYNNMFVVDALTAKVWEIGELPESFNGLTYVPKEVLGTADDVLIGISSAGGWFRLNVQGGFVVAFKLGEYGAPYTSSGDAYSITGIGTFASVNKQGVNDDILVEVDPANGTVLSEVGPLGYQGIWGLAGWTARAFGFDSDGAIVVVDTPTGDIVNVIDNTTQSWWGAAVRTIIF